MTAKGKECCEALKEPEKSIIGLRNLELIMLSVGESEPPSDWQETFKIIPETEEERYARLTGIRLKRNGQVKSLSVRLPVPLPVSLPVSLPVLFRKSMLRQRQQSVMPKPQKSMTRYLSFIN